jgi:hypothetical protein
MKTTILTAALALTVVLGVSRFAYAATGGKTEVSTTLTGVSNISEIEVHGNVQLYLTSANEERVKVYNNYYAEDALVQEQDGVLRITSYSAEKLVIWVTVNDLSKLSVFDNAKVTSFGQFSAIDLDVNLYNHGVAQLNMDAFNASVSLNDSAAADLSGVVENGTVQFSRTSYLNTANLAAANLTKTVEISQAKCDRRDVLASL